EDVVQLLVGTAALLVRAEHVQAGNDVADQDARQVHPATAERDPPGMLLEVQRTSETRQRVPLDQEDAGAGPGGRGGKGRPRGRFSDAARLTGDQELAHG